MERYDTRVKKYEWIVVDKSRCTGCGNCIEFCPRDALRADNRGFPYLEYRDDCWYCDVCKFVCKRNAIELETVPYLIR